MRSEEKAVRHLISVLLDKYIEAYEQEDNPLPPEVLSDRAYGDLDRIFAEALAKQPKEG